LRCRVALLGSRLLAAAGPRRGSSTKKASAGVERGGQDVLGKWQGVEGLPRYKKKACVYHILEEAGGGSLVQ